jgi:hypothetical protein
MQTLYVNVYEVGQGYGGPEEGGWWFQTGSPVTSIAVELTEDEWVEAKEDFELASRITLDDTYSIEVSGRWTAFLDARLRRKALKLRDELAESYPSTGKQYEVLGGDDWNVTIEEHFARFYPEEKPRYE